MESSRGECERRTGEIKSSVRRKCKLTEVLWESVPRSWCSVGKGAVNWPVVYMSSKEHASLCQHLHKQGTRVVPLLRAIYMLETKYSSSPYLLIIKLFT